MAKLYSAYSRDRQIEVQVTLPRGIEVQISLVRSLAEITIANFEAYLRDFKRIGAQFPKAYKAAANRESVETWRSPFAFGQNRWRIHFDLANDMMHGHGSHILLKRVFMHVFPAGPPDALT